MPWSWRATRGPARLSSRHTFSRAGTAWIQSRQETIREVIAHRWARYYPGRSRRPHVVVSGPTRLKSYSAIFEYAVIFPDAQPPAQIIAKIRRHARARNTASEGGVSETAVALGLREWEGMTSAYRYFASATDGLGVVRPLDYLDRHHVILVEKASGCDLGELVKAADPAASTALARAGCWLSHFHRGLHQIFNAEWSWPAYLARLELRRSRLVSQGVLPTVLDPLVRRAGDQAQRLSPVLVPRSVLHGDYKLKHIWATPDRIQVLDFGNVHPGECYADLAALLVELLAVRLGRPWVSRRRIGQYSGTLLHAYFAADPPPVFWLYVVEGLFKKWSHRLARWSGGDSTPWAVTLQRCVARVHGAAPVNELYVNQWFTSQIMEALQLASEVSR